MKTLSDTAAKTICALARGMSCTVESKVLKEILLSSGGELLCRGKLCPVQKKHLGVGVYIVSLNPEHVT